jgi:hypothetical protein
VRNLPINKTDEEVKEYFEKSFEGSEVVYVNYTYDIAEITAKIRDFNQWQSKANYIKHYEKLQA